MQTCTLIKDHTYTPHTLLCLLIIKVQTSTNHFLSKIISWLIKTYSNFRDVNSVFTKTKQRLMLMKVSFTCSLEDIKSGELKFVEIHGFGKLFIPLELFDILLPETALYLDFM